MCSFYSACDPTHSTVASLASAHLDQDITALIKKLLIDRRTLKCIYMQDLSDHCAGGSLNTNTMAHLRGCFLTCALVAGLLGCPALYHILRATRLCKATGFRKVELCSIPYQQCQLYLIKLEQNTPMHDWTCTLKTCRLLGKVFTCMRS